jgi:hypothetical protein
MALILHDLEVKINLYIAVLLVLFQSPIFKIN